MPSYLRNYYHGTGYSKHDRMHYSHKSFVTIH